MIFNIKNVKKDLELWYGGVLRKYNLQKHEKLNEYGLGNKYVYDYRETTYTVEINSLGDLLSLREDIKEDIILMNNNIFQNTIMIYDEFIE